MAKPETFSPALLGVALESGAAKPAYQQLYEQVRDLILSGRLPSGARLPSTRSYSKELGLSRTTLIAAYDQLVSEGYLEARRGAGIFVSQFSPEHLMLVNRTAPPVLPKPGAARRRAARPVPFSIRATSPADFPGAEWARLLQKTWRGPIAGHFGEPHVEGHPGLKVAIADHLRTWRGISCSEDQVLITSSSAESIDLISRVLCQPGDKVWLENPGYMPMRREIVEKGLEPFYVPIDREGMMVNLGVELAKSARMAITTPPRQFPLGMTMSLPRRLDLLDWARSTGAWVVEDDYDSEFRYEGRPLAALMSMDETGRVLYLGSFSKVMFKSLRLGYLVVPPDLSSQFHDAHAELGPQASSVAQPALAEFITSGQFAAHIRRMRRLYARRRALLLDQLLEKCSGLVTPQPANSGMHIVVSIEPILRARHSDVEICRRLRQDGIEAQPLSSFYAAGFDPGAAGQGLLLGFSGFEEKELEVSVTALAAALSDLAAA
ncbi:MAG: PLP-dependent aminotransferase family protein [Alphaproteobacteria bacterium]|nr:PLP-dependent aminotransferase family protein [Alphaproteobacteria bacterium]